MGYKHGTYGTFEESVSKKRSVSNTIPVYIGTAPVNLLQDSKNWNTPVLIRDLDEAKKQFGYSEDWDTFSLCEAFKVHFDNDMGNAGPIVVINVLDPTVHKAEEITQNLNFVNGKAVLQNDHIILNTLVLADKVNGTDFTASYDFDKQQVVISSIGESSITGEVQATYAQIDAGAVTEKEIIGDATDGGIYTGLGCVDLIYQELNLIPNVIVAPAWSEKPQVYKAMIKAGTKINGHWDAFVNADIPLVDKDAKKVDTIALAKEWQSSNEYTNERSKVYWPQAMDTKGKAYHLSVLATWLMQRIDAGNSGIPMESPSNKEVPASKQYFGISDNRGFDQQKGNGLNEAGITTVVFWGGQWVLWGPHTAAYKYSDTNTQKDWRVTFDNNIRMMMHISNSFQQEHAATVDEPMTRAIADTIRNREQEKADALVAIGALIGTPTVEFREAENSTDEVLQGNFIWSFVGTPTPPFKSGELGVSYTPDGFNSYLDGGIEA